MRAAPRPLRRVARWPELLRQWCRQAEDRIGVWLLPWRGGTRQLVRSGRRRSSEDRPRPRTPCSSTERLRHRFGTTPEPRHGAADRATHRPAKLSGGEQQRVAIARALANSPDVLIADEPTGNLDQETAERVFALLMQLTRDTGVAALVATHNPDLAARMDRKVTLRNGVLEEV
ncbi:MAG: ATP-binding cassette domain-containing protein [Alphaproteobacteria bacterium]|nr:ATP-binding cassette domain-containing protein [Alphaproteobacteria bacterium]